MRAALPRSLRAFVTVLLLAAGLTVGLTTTPATAAPTVTVKDWTYSTDAIDVVGLAAPGLYLYAADSHNQLWSRVKTDPRNVPWQRVGHANSVVGLAAPNDGFVYAADRNNRLWRAAEDHDNWSDIGPAVNVRAMTAADGFLYAADRNNRLWFRGEFDDGNVWTGIGEAINVVGLAAPGDGFLYAADSGNQLWRRRPFDSGTAWQRIDGRANGVVGMGGQDGELFVADRNNRLWFAYINEE